MARQGGKPADWYVGAAIDPKGRMAKHGFKRGYVGAIRTAHSEIRAHDGVEYFVQSRKTKGDPTVERNALHVYTDRTNSHTRTLS